MAKIAELNLGKDRLVVETKHLVFDNIELLAHGYAEIKEAHSLFAEYPMLEDETTEQWQERVLPLLADETSRKDGESQKEYLNRIYAQKLDRHKLIFDVISLVAEVCGQKEKATQDNFKKSSYPECKSFLVSVFSSCDLSTRDFE